MSEPWEKSYDIIDNANKKIEKNKKDVNEILKKQVLSEDDHKKINELLETESEIRNKAIEKVEKIHREKIKNFEQEWNASK